MSYVRVFAACASGFLLAIVAGCGEDGPSQATGCSPGAQERLFCTGGLGVIAPGDRLWRCPAGTPEQLMHNEQVDQRCEGSDDPFCGDGDRMLAEPILEMDCVAVGQACFTSVVGTTLVAECAVPFECTDGRKTIKGTERCDGTVDCDDSSDETGC